MTAAHEPLVEEVSTPQAAGWLTRAHHGSIGLAAQVEGGSSTAGRLFLGETTWAESRN